MGKNFVSYFADRPLISRIHKDLKNPKLPKIKDSVKNGQEKLVNNSQRRKYKKSTDIWKNVQHL